jgi:hypothetical protein
MMTTPDAFEPLRNALERAGVRFAVGGSWASTAHGEARFTNDVDISSRISRWSVWSASLKVYRQRIMQTSTKLVELCDSADRLT